MSALSLYPLADMPEVTPNSDLSAILLLSMERLGLRPLAGDVLVLAQKVISKKEGREVSLHSVSPGAEALSLAKKTALDPSLLQLILNESEQILSIRRNVIMTRHRLGWTLANAGIDASNTTGEGRVILLPADPDQSAKNLSREICTKSGTQLSVIISDTHGRPHRRGIIGVAIGSYGIAPLKQYKGLPDRRGRPLTTSIEAVADELASAAGLLMGQANEGIPAVLIRGFPHPFDDCGVEALKRPPEEDLFVPKETY